MNNNYSLYNTDFCYDDDNPNNFINILLNILYFIPSIAFFTSAFVLIDQKISPQQGKYYFVHSICNFLIVNTTFYDVIAIYNNPYSGLETVSYLPSILTYSLHFYHIIEYHPKFRFDDWLHHILMIFVCLPLGNYFGTTRLLSHSLFYTTGLPGMIDYICLTLVRNGLLNRIREKQINRYLNIWIRCPGCIIHVFLSLLLIHKMNDPIDMAIAIVTMSLVGWNGVYFMDQVVGNYYIETEFIKSQECIININNSSQFGEPCIDDNVIDNLHED